MQDEIRQDKDLAVTDKKERTLKILRKAAYILVALASAICLVMMLVGANSVVVFEDQDAVSLMFYLLMPATTLAMVVLAVMNAVRDFPRLMMLFAGSSVFFAIRYLTLGWIPGLLLLAAGLSALALTATRQYTLLKDDPREKVKGKMLIIAAVLAILYSGYQGYISIMYATAYAAYGIPQNSTFYFFTGLATIAFNLSLAAACFMKNRRTSVFYRMFFLGAMFVLTLQLPSKWIGVDFSGADFLAWIQVAASVAVLVITVLVLLHAILTRCKKAAAVAEAEAEEAAEEPEDEVDDTIGLYKEEDEADVYKEDETQAAAEEASEDGEDQEDK